MNVTVILCTYNRCGSLAKTLSSLAASVLPDSVEWEVLVADNNSSDQTREVTENFSRQFPGRFRYLFESQPGKSYALNSAIRAARGEIVAFTDDDVTVDANWLYNLTAPLNDGAWMGAGGRTLAANTFSAPPWLLTEGSDSMTPILFAHFDRGDKPAELDWPPYGANMAFRKAMFEKYGEFRTDLGPSPDKSIPRPNEDTEFGRRLLAASERLRYEPSAIVYHPVIQDRLKKEYFLAWWFDFGRAAIREKGKRPEICGIPRHYFIIPKRIILMPPKILRWMLALNPRRRFFLKAKVWYSAGEFMEICRQSRRKERGR
jgi:glycosyltransferase involved in cell wall biosynthesis